MSPGHESKEESLTSGQLEETFQMSAERLSKLSIRELFLPPLKLAKKSPIPSRSAAYAAEPLSDDSEHAAKAS